MKKWIVDHGGVTGLTFLTENILIGDFYLDPNMNRLPAYSAKRWERWADNRTLRNWVLIPQDSRRTLDNVS